MAKKRTVDIVEDLVTPIIQQTNLELVDIEFVKEGQDKFLRVYIDKEEGVTLDDCQKVSELLSEKLDEVDPIEESYFLEVSSPGIDRVLKKDIDFERFKGKLVEVSLYQSMDGKKVIEGELLGLKDNFILLKNEINEKLEIDRAKIAKVKLAVKI